MRSPVCDARAESRRLAERAVWSRQGFERDVFRADGIRPASARCLPSTAARRCRAALSRHGPTGRRPRESTVRARRGAIDHHSLLRRARPRCGLAWAAGTASCVRFACRRTAPTRAAARPSHAARDAGHRLDSGLRTGIWGLAIACLRRAGGGQTSRRAGRMESALMIAKTSRSGKRAGLSRGHTRLDE